MRDTRITRCQKRRRGWRKRWQSDDTGRGRGKGKGRGRAGARAGARQGSTLYLNASFWKEQVWTILMSIYYLYRFDNSAITISLRIINEKLQGEGLEAYHFQEFTHSPNDILPIMLLNAHSVSFWTCLCCDCNSRPRVGRRRPSCVAMGVQSSADVPLQMLPRHLTRGVIAWMYNERLWKTTFFLIFKHKIAVGIKDCSF